MLVEKHGGKKKKEKKMKMMWREFIEAHQRGRSKELKKSMEERKSNFIEIVEVR